jgi:hypothetical protein
MLEIQTTVKMVKKMKDQNQPRKRKKLKDHKLLIY